MLALTAGFFFAGLSVTEQYVFTISDGQLIVPLPTGSKPSEGCGNAPPSAGTYGASQTNSASPPTTTGIYTVPMLDVYRDGATCPEGSEACSKRSDGVCEYGNAISDRKSDGRCCWVIDQYAFINSRKGGENHLGAKYQFDSRTCCDPGTEPTAYTGGKCQYGSASLSVPSDYLTRCCYNDKEGDFVLHMKQFQPNYNNPDAKIETRGHARNGFCNLGYIVQVHGVRLYGNRVELDLSGKFKVLVSFRKMID